MSPLLSIIIPVYKVEQYLSRCLDSITTEVKEEDIEVIVIDDGSPDQSGEIADFYASKYPYIRVIHKKNEGVAAARNTGIEHAQGKWLYFADPDDYLAKSAIQIFLKRINENPDADMILMDAWKNVGSREYPWEHFRRGFIWEDKKKIRALQRGALYFPSTGNATKISLAAPWDKLYRRAFLQKESICFQPNLKVLDDMVFNVAAFGSAQKVVYSKDKVYHYCYVSDSITNSFSPDRMTQDRKVWKYLQNYMTESFKKDVWEPKDKYQFIQAYYHRIIKSFSICCRLSFFNSKNENTVRDKIEFVKEVLGREPYRTAFWKGALRGAEWRLKIMTCVGRCRWGRGVYFLHLVQSIFSKALHNIMC